MRLVFEGWHSCLEMLSSLHKPFYWLSLPSVRTFSWRFSKSPEVQTGEMQFLPVQEYAYFRRWRLGAAQGPATHHGGPDGISDLVVLLRQLIRWTQPLVVTCGLWSSIQSQAEQSGLVGNLVDGLNVEVMAVPWHSTWLKDSEEIDLLVQRRQDEAEPGDGMLYGIGQAGKVGWTTYCSGAQKAAVDCWTFAAPGSTTLVTLPTGGGKSLCALLPPWFASRGGRHSQGTTLVVVPTVALAVDQERQAQRFFANAAGDLSRPISRTGDTSQEERRAIEAALRDGRLPLIYTSPESLLGSRLYDVCLQAAREGLITRFVIDEAHLIASWGAGFRPEFQLLAAYRRRLVQESGGQLRTLLLSATMAGNSRELIEKQFAEPGRLVVVEANRLRPEISYYMHFSQSAAARQHRVIEALRYLPRPLILYLTRPEHAREWEQTLRDQGYRRIASFSGETGSDARRQLIKAWNDNQIDVMVATSAFGLGVDKGDIRSVLHATLPENIDRFYQEVGRGGRDGYSSVSLVCAAHDMNSYRSDVDLAYNLQGKIITTEKGLPRWQGMLASAVVEGEVRWLDRDAPPIGHPEMAGSERNRDWNDHQLLLMQRARLIQVADAPPPSLGQDGAPLHRLPVKILDLEAVNNPVEALGRIEPYREQEKNHAQEAVRGIIDLVSDYHKLGTEECLSARFGAIYQNVQYACGGCPVCRTSGEVYCAPLQFTVDYPFVLRQAARPGAEVDGTLRQRMGAWRSLIASWDGPRTLTRLANYSDLIPALVGAGCQQVIYPEGLLDDADLREQILIALASPGPMQQPVVHRVVPDYWLTEKDYPLLPLPSAIFYPPDDRHAGRLFESIVNAMDRGIALPAIVHVVHEAVYLKKVGRRFLEHVDGLNETVAGLLELLKGAQMPPELF